MVNTNFKVGYLFFNNLSYELPHSFNFASDANIDFSTEIIDIEDKIWREWLGLKWNDIKESNAMIRIEVPTNTPEVLDGENKELEELCNKAYIALQLSGDFKVTGTNFFTGSKINGKINLRQYIEYDHWYCSERFKKMKKEDIEIWGKLLKRLIHCYSRVKTGQFIRFNRGLMNFQKGCSESYLDFRLPYFVRSLEALVLPDKGQTEKQFKKRILKWWPKSFKGDAISILGEIYGMRCDFEHLHGVKEKYNEIQLLRGYQCEVVTRTAYKTILLNNAELENFSTDVDIRKYWNK